MEGKVNGFEEYRDFINQYASCMDAYPYFYDVEQDLYCISPKALERFAVPSCQFSGVLETHTEFVYEEDFMLLIQDLKKLESGEKDEHDIEYRWVGKDGSPIWVNCRGKVVRDEDGNIKYMLGCINEIAKKKKADNITGLKSISSMEETLETFCRVAAGGYTLHIGIDNFKVINERFGHKYGDFILRSVAECVETAIGPGQEVYHVTADELLVVDYFSDTAESARALYESISKNVDKFIKNNRYETVFTVSGGVLSCKELGGMSYEEFIKLSEFALSRAKVLGKNQVYYFCVEDYENFLYNSTILSALKESIASDFEGYEVSFLPVSEQDEAEYEAVLSYTMPNGEKISFDRCVAVLEENGLMDQVEKWIMDKVAAFCEEKESEVPNTKVMVSILSE